MKQTTNSLLSGDYLSPSLTIIELECGNAILEDSGGGEGTIGGNGDGFLE